MDSGPQPRLLRRMKWWGRCLLIGALLFIGSATLTPATSTGASGLPPDFWCVACGPEGGADITLNVALFLPLGVALAMLRVCPWRALVVGTVLSIGIEAAQRAGFPEGRVASISDLLTNSSGTLLGALVAWHARRWTRPSPRAAAAFSVVSVLVVTSFLTFTAWALGRNPDQPLGLGQAGLTHSRGALATGYGWYHGQVSRVVVGDSQFRQAGDGPVILSGSTSSNWRGAVDIEGRDERREFVPFLVVQGTHPLVPDMMLGQRNNNAMLHVRLRGSQFRLPGPALDLSNAFVEGDPVQRTVRFSVTSELWTLSSTAGAATLATALPVSLSLGWTLFQTVVHTGDRAALVVTFLWLFVLWLPVGYWCAIAGQRAAGTEQLRGNFQRWQFVAAGMVALLLTLWRVPPAMGIAATLPREWALSVAGFVLGGYLARHFRHYIPSQ